MNARTILLVEDNPDDIKLTIRAFKKVNLVNELITIRDGATALEFLLGTGADAGRPASPLPELILLDLKLPKIDGLELLQRIRSNPRTRRVPVIILTCSKEEQDVIRSYDLGANSYVRKPVDFEQFTQAAKQLGMYWLLLNEPPPRPS